MVDVGQFWSLDPGTTQLNHGSYGACPRPVLAEQSRIRQELEANPTRWFDLTYPGAVRAAREELAAFVGSSPAALAFVSNATSAVNLALRTVVARLAPGDELLVTSHAYPACRHAVDALTAATGVTVRVIDVPDCLGSPEELTALVLGGVGERTRALLIDHVVSSTGVVVPVEDIVGALEPDVVVIVDGAHAPGMVGLDLDTLGASFYAGNAHKWLCAPKGAAFVRVAEAWREDVLPLTISHGWSDPRPADGGRFHALFDWPGTSDPSAWLSVPCALREISGLRPGGWDAVRRENRDLVLRAQSLLCTTFGTAPPVPASMVGALAVVPLSGAAGQATPDQLTAHARDHSIEAKFHVHDGSGTAVRLSAQLYNSLEDYERLAHVLALV